MQRSIHNLVTFRFFVEVIGLMRKERPSALISAIVLATAIFNVSTAVLNLWTARAKLPEAEPAVTAAACPTTQAPQVIQYLNLPPAVAVPETAKEPPRPAGQ